MTAHYTNYNSVRWSNTIEKYVRRAKRYKLSVVEYVPITQKELESISEINDIRLERVMFSFLCCAKLYNLKSKKNNNWSNVSAKEIFRMARVNTSIENQDYYINDLLQLGYVHCSSNTLNVRVEIVDDDTSEENVVLKITDFKKLSYEYRNWKRGALFICKKCGKIYKQNKQCNRIYCKECSMYQPIETKTIVCKDCGKEFEVDSKDNQTNRCQGCYNKYISELNQKKYRELHPDEFKSIICVDCGCEFTVIAKDNQTTRCSECYKKYRREYWAEIKRKSRRKECPQHK